MDNIVGNSGDNTIDGSLKTTVAGQLNTLGSADKIDGGAGTDTLFVQNVNVTTTSPASVKNVEILQIDAGNTAGNAYTLNLQNGDSSLTTVKSGNNNTAGGTVTVTNVQAAVKTVELSNTNQNFTLTAAAAALTGTADALGVTLSGVTAGTVALTANSGANGFETLNINSNGSVANALTALTTDTSLATINVTGAQNLNLGAALNNAVTKVDANAFTGNLTVTAGASITTVTGGKGNDTLNFDANYTAADVINGGEGTDTLRLSSAQAIVTTAQSNVTNVETLRIGDSLNGALNATFFSGVTGVVVNTTAPATALTGGNSTITFAPVTTGSNTVTLNSGADSEDVAYTLGVTVNGTATNDVVAFNVQNVDFANGNVLTFTGAETVNLVSSNGKVTGAADTAADGGANVFDAITLTNTAATETLNISGDAQVTIGVGGTDAVTADVINASGLTAALVMSAATVAAGGVQLTGGTAGDTLFGSAQGDVISGGAGADDITALAGADLVNGGTGADIFRITAAAQGGNAVAGNGAGALTAGDTYADFTSGTGGDVLNVAAAANGTAVASGLAGAANLSTNGVYIITGSNLDFVLGTTSGANVSAAIGNVTTAGAVTAYVAILDTQSTASTADDVYNVFEIVTGGAVADAALGASDTISLVGTLNTATILTTDFVA